MNFPASLTKRVGFGNDSQRYGSADPRPYQNAADPEHWLKEFQVHQKKSHKISENQSPGTVFLLKNRKIKAFHKNNLYFKQIPKPKRRSGE
jgi:hypothetical protein